MDAFKKHPPAHPPPPHEPMDNEVEWERLRVMWILVSTLFLLWLMLMAIQHLFRSAALWKISKGDYASPLVAAVGESREEAGATTTTTPATTTTTQQQAPHSSQSEWLLRFRHAAKITRDATTALLVTTLLTQLLTFRRPVGEQPRDDFPGSPGHPSGLSLYRWRWCCNLSNPFPESSPNTLHFTSPHLNSLGNPSSFYSGEDWRDRLGYQGGSVWTPYVLTIIIFVLTALQILVHLVVEPLAKSSATARHRGYEYFGPGIYGGRHEISGKWLDPVFDLARVVMLILLVAVALSTATYAPSPGWC